MPDAKVFQHSDLTTKEVGGVDGVIRSQSKDPLIVHRVQHMIDEGDAECLSIDVDVLFMDSIADIFNDRFDAALIKRSSSAVYEGQELLETQPYVGSMVATRGPEFWTLCLEELRKMSAEDQAWFGHQKALATVAKGCIVKELPEDIYSYTPLTFGDPLDGIKAVHFKGQHRKTWMLAA